MDGSSARPREPARTHTRTRTVYLLKVLGETQLCYLRATGSDWGPGYLPTGDVWEALRFHSLEAVSGFIRDEARGSGWTLQVVRATLTEKMEMATT